MSRFDSTPFLENNGALTQWSDVTGGFYKQETLLLPRPPCLVSDFQGPMNVDCGALFWGITFQLCKLLCLAYDNRLGFSNRNKHNVN